jgi:hypothetical protein
MAYDNQAALATNRGKMYMGTPILICHGMQTEGKCTKRTYSTWINRNLFDPSSDHAYDMRLRMRVA